MTEKEDKQMDKKSSSAGGGAGFTSRVLVAFIVLKLCHVIDWPWVWVLAPLWISIIVVFVVLIIVFFLDRK